METETAQTTVEGDPFTDAGNEPPAVGPPNEPAYEPEPLPNDYGQPEPEPDLSGQEQALLQKFEGQLEYAEPQGNEQPADDDVYWNDEHGVYVDAAGNPVPEDQIVEVDEQGNEIPAQQGTTGDPVLDNVIAYLNAEQQEAQEQAVLELFEENKDMREPAVLDAVEAKAEELAALVGNPYLATHPKIVEHALASVRVERASPTAVSADQARKQGATLPTDAGASVDSSPSPEDQWWGNVKNSPGQAFPDLQ